jgi:hypothetical protein
MLVFSYAVELDAVEPSADGYEALVRDAARAYRLRAACSEVKGNATAANRDVKRADVLTAKLKRPESATAANAPAAGRVEVRNDWPEPVTLVIAGVSYTLPPGESKALPAPAASVPYEMIAGQYRVTGTIDAGKSYRVRPPSASTK